MGTVELDALSTSPLYYDLYEKLPLNTTLSASRSNLDWRNVALVAEPLPNDHYYMLTTMV